MNGWLSFDTLGSLLTPGRRRVCEAVCDKSSTILSFKRHKASRSDSSIFVLIIRKTLNQHSFVASRSRKLGWRLRCIARL